MSLVAGVLTLAAPVQAKAPAARLSVHPAAASFHVGSVVLVTGTVTPNGTAPVSLQRLSGTKWVGLAHAKPAATGTFTFAVRAPKTALTWHLRAVRAKSRAAKALTSPTIIVHVVKPIFQVAATTDGTVVDGSPVVVTGKVSPRAVGTVLLQAFSGSTWFTFASAKLSKTSTFRLEGLQLQGSHRVRVVKAATAAVAEGVSRTAAVTVVPAPLLVLTASLPAGTAGVPYIGQLSAAGGTAPYHWAVSVGTLPAGLSVSPGGQLSGTPLLPATTGLAFTVTDTAGRTATAALSVTVAPSPPTAHRVKDWGGNANGQLGDGTKTASSTPVLVGLTGVTVVAGGQYTSYALRSDGTVWGWGDNSLHQLANNVPSTSTIPVQIGGLSQVTAIAGGVSSGYALKADGTVWSWGNNDHGQLGNSTDIPSATPVQVTGLAHVTAIASNQQTGYALTSAGTVWAWGKGVFGNLGNGDTLDTMAPVQVTGLTNAVGIAAGAASGYALLSDGTVRSWGLNIYGQLGEGSLAHTIEDAPVTVSSLAGVRQIAGGYFDGYALLADGTVRAWGTGTEGELGNGSSAHSDLPVAVYGATDVTAVASAGAAGYALRRDGSVLSWGFGENGELGNATVTSSGTAAPVPGLSSVVGIGAGFDTGYAITAF